MLNEHKGNHPEAFTNYDSALKYDRDIYDAHKKRGIYYTELKQWLKAIQDFNEMRRINPASVSVYRFRGAAMFYHGAVKNALEDFNKYLSIDSSSYDVHGYRGVVYLQLGEVLLSTLDFLQSNQRYGIPHRDTVFIAIKKLCANDTAKAVWYLDKFIEHQYDPAYRMKVTILMNQGRWAEVKTLVNSLWKRIERENGADPNRWFLSSADRAYLAAAGGICLAKNGRHQAAMNMFNTAISTDSNCGIAYLERGRLYRKLGDDKSAQRDLKAAARRGVQESSTF